MNICMSVMKQVQPLLNFQGGLNMDSPFFRQKDKVVFVMGATGTGKSRLAIDLATRFPAEIINSDKIQVHKGLDIVTNKVSEDECLGIPHHLLGTIDPYSNFTSNDFQNRASHAIETILEKDRLPIIAGGSNSYIEALVNNCPEFRSKYQCCFLWVDVSIPILHPFVSERVDKMVESGLVDEVKQIFDPKDRNYLSGIRRAIGVPELDKYLRAEISVDRDSERKILHEAICKIKENTRSLACRQLQKLHRLYKQWDWSMHRIEADEVFLKRDCKETWEKHVAGPCTMIVDRFLNENDRFHTIMLPETMVGVTSSKVGLAPVAALTV